MKRDPKEATQPVSAAQAAWDLDPLHPFSRNYDSVLVRISSGMHFNRGSASKPTEASMRAKNALMPQKWKNQ